MLDPSCQNLNYWDARTITAILAFFVSFISIFVSLYLHRSTRTKQEVRDHFDADIRDIVYEELRELRVHRRKVVDVALGGITPKQSTNIAKEIDSIRDKDIGHTLYEIRQATLEAHHQYGHRLGIIEKGNVGGMAERQSLSEMFVENIDEKYDLLMETLSVMQHQIRAESTPVDTADFSDGVYNFGHSVREFLNELRSIISTKRGRNTINS